MHDQRCCHYFLITRNKQDDGQIPDISVHKTKSYCVNGDLVCDGGLVITLAHLSYTTVTDAIDFLFGKIGILRTEKSSKHEQLYPEGIVAWSVSHLHLLFNW